MYCSVLCCMIQKNTKRSPSAWLGAPAGRSAASMGRQRSRRWACSQPERATAAGSAASRETPKQEGHVYRRRPPTNYMWPCWCDYRDSASGGVWPDTAWAQNEVSSPSSPGHRRPESSSDWPRWGPPVAPAARRCRPSGSGCCSGWWRSSDICSCWRSSASPDGPNEEE